MVWWFMRLYIPLALSSASDFWRMALLGIFVAQNGEDEVAVFNSSYRILWISLTCVGSLALPPHSAELHGVKR